MKRLFIASVLVLGLAGPVFAATTPGPRVALVIGNSAYRDTPLANPANDARLMVRTLRGLGFEVIEQIDADQKAMKTAILEFGDRLEEAGQDAVGLFYYAGHGLQVGNQNFLVPLNSAIKREKDVAVEAVSAAWVLGQMEFAGNRVNFVILDACRNNPLTRSFRSPTRGLARMDAPRGSLVAYSTAPGKVAADGTGANSPFTLALARAMRTPDIPAEKMFKLVRDSVMAATRGNQTPWEESSLTGEDFYFSVSVSVSVERPEVQSLADTAAITQQETVFWQSIEGSDSPADFEAYLARYPNGAFVDLARNRLNKLKETQTAAVIPPPRPPAAPAVKPAVGVYPRLKPGDAFKDCPECPEMVAIPPGTFRMGDIRGTGRSNLRPVHTVTIPKPFAIGKYEVTFDEYDRFIDATGRSKPSDHDWGRGRRPIVKVPWEDAVVYTEWLSEQTGKHYRLPTEAEWEYAARAGTETEFWWGNMASHDYANYGTGIGGWFPRGLASGNDQWVYTAPVGSFPPNPFGLYDMHGNVWEHVQDCYHDNHVGAPSDGSARLSGNCRNRVIRSGSWGYESSFMRSDARSEAFWAVKAFLYNGFRVARTLP